MYNLVCSSRSRKKHKKLHILFMASAALEEFSKYLGEFVTALDECFPESDGVRRFKLKYDLAIGQNPDSASRVAAEEMVLREFHAHMQPLFKRMSEEDATLFDGNDATELPEFARIVKEVWGDMDGEMRTVVWEYLGWLRRTTVCFMLCDRLPDTLTDAMQDIGTSMGATGGGAPPDIAAMGSKIMSHLGGGTDMSAMQALMGDPTALADVCTVAMEQLQHLQKTMAQQAPPGSLAAPLPLAPLPPATIEPLDAENLDLLD